MGKLFTQGWYDRVEALLALARTGVASALAYLNAPRAWAQVPAGGIDQPLTTNAFVIVNGATTPAVFIPRSTGKIRVFFNIAVAAGAAGDELQVGVSIGPASVAPVFAIAAPITVPANDRVQVSGVVDLDQLSPAVVFPLNVPAVVNVIAAATTANRLTLTGNASVCEFQEVQ